MLASATTNIAIALGTSGAGGKYPSKGLNLEIVSGVRLGI